MAGGGFMQHASNTNRKDRAQRAARREKFNANHSDKTVLNNSRSTKIDFSHLSPEQIASEKQRIAKEFQRRKKKQRIAIIISTCLVIALLILFSTLL